MTFLFPGFLFALFSLSVPIFIHLFNFRRYKTVFFTNVRFLKEVKKDTQSKNRLRQLLILAARILALSALIFAFAQPFILSESNAAATGQRAVSVYLDNSFSMDAIGKNGALLEDARNKAREIATTFSSSDRFQLLTNDFEGRHQRLVNKEEFLEMLDEVKLSPGTRNFTSVATRQNDALKSSGLSNLVAYVLSDFQRTVTDLEVFSEDTTVRYNLVPLQSNSRGNVFIDSVWFPSPVRQKDRNDKVFVRIKNLSANVLEDNPVKLFINGQQRSPASYTLEPGASGETFLSFISRESGIQNCRVEITDHPLTFDDAFYFSFDIKKQIPVLCINEQSADSAASSLAAVYSDSLFLFKEMDGKTIDYSSFSRYSLIILNGIKLIQSGLAADLRKFLESGGSVLVIPAESPDLPSYKNFLQPMQANFPESLDTAKLKVSKLFYEHPLFEDVFDKKPENLDLPVTTSHYRLSRSVTSTQEILLQLQNGDAFLSVCRAGEGKIYLSAVPLSTKFSNFTRHALFVPVFFQAALHSQPQKRLSYTVGNNEPINNIQTPSGTDKVLHLKGAGELDIIPETRANGNFTSVYTNDQIRAAGNYTLHSGDTILAGISFNFDRKESDPSCFTNDELKAITEKKQFHSLKILETGERNMADLIKITEQGTPLWKWFIILCLFFLGMEVCLIRFMK